MSFPCKDSRERENSAKDMPGEKEAGSSAGREPLNLPSAGIASSKKTTVSKDERGGRSRGRERRGREGEWGGVLRWQRKMFTSRWETELQRQPTELVQSAPTDAI